MDQKMSDALRPAIGAEQGKTEWSKSRIDNHIAHALARGYAALFYVDLDTGDYIEYHTDDLSGVLSRAREGSDFFEHCAREAELTVYPDDRAAFTAALDREALTKALGESRLFELTYRVLRDGAPIYVRMQVTRSEDDPHFLVVAVSDVDELMRQRRAEARTKEERTIYARLHALTGNFICVYVVDPVTNRYREFSATRDYEECIDRAKEGEDFFRAVRADARLFNHPDDLERFLAAFTKENVLEKIGSDGVFTWVYRILMNGRPLHVRLTAAMVEEQDGKRLIVGLNNIDAEYKQRQLEKEIARQKEVFNQITASLAAQYDTLYYIDVETNTYSEISSTDDYKKLNVPATGSDFFAESRRSIRRYVHPEDQEKAIRLHYKDVMLDNLKTGSSFSQDWRLVVNGEVRHIRHTEIMARDKKHIIVCIKNIDAEVRARLAMSEDRKKNVTYTQIAERLASHYDFIYYIDCETSYYAELSVKQRSGALKIQQEGADFFTISRKNADRLIYAKDRERIRLFLDRDHLISELARRRQLIEDYRMIVDGGRLQYTRMSVTYSSDHTHFIICVENRDEDVRREQEHLAALTTANEIARRDALTHAKNKTAYHEAEMELQKKLKQGGGEPFGIVVCDINGLKIVNDTEGHNAGDDYIRSACKLICQTFRLSPVYRVGGDEFVVLLRGQDYSEREKLLAALRRQVDNNIRIGEGPVVASGVAVYEPERDLLVGDVFNRADSLMYENKSRLKEQRLSRESRALNDRAGNQEITEDRRIMLDTLFRSFEMVSEGTYVYLCDMKFDYSRWSKAAVDNYGLPSEYMYGAGDIWENRIHPDDRAAYHKGIDEIFAGIAADHDMQYRAKRVSGAYDVCTCRGVVIRDPSGEPDYFVGTIRNHSEQGHIDALTGLRNQYGFFEDLDGHIKRRAEVSVTLCGISRFSEINEMYGYRFGNRVLQRYARIVLEAIGNTGHVYRIDGTKLAVISSPLTMEELRERYDRFRAFLHESFSVDGRKLLLDVYCGALRLDRFDVDSQTVYACLLFANTDSKRRRQGELVEFQSALNEESHQMLDKLHAIRASIKRGCEGFYLLYQPVVDARTEKLIGAEALLRWKDERYGMVPPDQFIPILESDPLFPELGEWIIREAVLAAKQMLRRCPSFVMNVNLSYTQMEKPDFVDMVLRILEDYGYPPEHLCLEVTERCRLLDMALLKNVLAGLKSHGIPIALDDFGTGFSSVGILKEMPIDIIKLDHSFVRRIEENDTERRLVGNIADLATIFHTKVCVEGIETAGMRDILRGYRVGSFQGYYYAKPLPLEQLSEWKDKEE